MSINLSGFKTWINETEKSIWPEVIQEKEPKVKDLRSAAIMIMLVKNGTNSNYSFVITLRSEDVPTHKGQCAFPGGGQKENESLLQTAIRETKEETGINIDFNQSEWDLLGQYPVKFITISNYLVAPFVAVYNSSNGEQLRYVPDGYEIAEVFEVPLTHLLNPENKRMEQREWQGVKFDLNFYYFENKVIWGVTGMILEHFLDKLQPFVNLQ